MRLPHPQLPAFKCWRIEKKQKKGENLKIQRAYYSARYKETPPLPFSHLSLLFTQRKTCPFRDTKCVDFCSPNKTVQKKTAKQLFISSFLFCFFFSFLFLGLGLGINVSQFGFKELFHIDNRSCFPRKKERKNFQSEKTKQMNGSFVNFFGIFKGMSRDSKDRYILQI